MHGGAHEVELEAGEYRFAGNAAHTASVELCVADIPAVTASVTFEEPVGDPQLTKPRRKTATREVEPARQVWEAVAVESSRFIVEPGHYRITAGRGELNLCREE
jgi:hypothetical protein